MPTYIFSSCIFFGERVSENALNIGANDVRIRMVVVPTLSLKTFVDVLAVGG